MKDPGNEVSYKFDLLSYSSLSGPLNYPRLNVNMTWSSFQRNFPHVFSEFLWRQAHFEDNISKEKKFTLGTLIPNELSQ